MQKATLNVYISLATSPSFKRCPSSSSCIINRSISDLTPLHCRWLNPLMWRITTGTSPLILLTLGIISRGWLEVLCEINNSTGFVTVTAERQQNFYSSPNTVAHPFSTYSNATFTQKPKPISLWFQFFCAACEIKN